MKTWSESDSIAIFDELYLTIVKYMRFVAVKICVQLSKALDSSKINYEYLLVKGICLASYEDPHSADPIQLWLTTDGQYVELIMSPTTILFHTGFTATIIYVELSDIHLKYNIFYLLECLIYQFNKAFKSNTSKQAILSPCIKELLNLQRSIQDSSTNPSATFFEMKVLS